MGFMSSPSAKPCSKEATKNVDRSMMSIVVDGEVIDDVGNGRGRKRKGKESQVLLYPTMNSPKSMTFSLC
jgi:hypothetical protein